MEFERVILEIEGAVAVLSLNHPEVLNALSPEMFKRPAKFASGEKQAADD